MSDDVRKWPALAGVQKRNRLSLPSLGLGFSERKVLLGMGDAALINLALWLALMLRPFTQLTGRSPSENLHWFALLTLLWFVAAQFANLYDLSRAANGILSAAYSGLTVLFVVTTYTFMPYLTPPLPERRIYFFLFPALALGLVMGWRLFYATLVVQPVFRRTGLVVGAGWSGRTLARALAHADENGGKRINNAVYELLGFVDDDPDKQREMLEGLPVLGNRHELVDLVRRLQPDDLVVSITHSQLIHGALFQAILDCREMGVSITTMPALYESVTGRVPVEHAGRNISVILPVAQPNGRRFYLGLRRLYDLIAALLGCLALVVLIPVVWFCNRFTDPGDLFYRQERVGKGGRPFQILKFRSMVMDAEKGTGAVWAEEDDPRVTPVGRILRRTRLDEFPQFWNVLKGEMSLVGPRPERPLIVAGLSQEIPFYRVRHAVKPGITGWAQVEYRYGASVKDSLIKLQYDLYYIKHQGLYIDFLILLKTIQVVLGLRGR